MNISELDEAQGLTAEMVRDFLRGRGFECEDGWKWKHRSASRRLVYADLESAPLNSDSTLLALSLDGVFASAQEMLRLMAKTWTGLPEKWQETLCEAWDQAHAAGRTAEDWERLASWVQRTSFQWVGTNPRLRKGVPSLAARRVHCRNGGMWIGAVGDLGLGGSMLFVSFMDPELDTDDGMAVWTAEEWCNYASAKDLEKKCADWKFWPVDLHGNKVRWPVGPEGML